MMPEPVSPESTTHEINVVPMNFCKVYKTLSNGEFEEYHTVDLVKKGSSGGESTPYRIKVLQENKILWPFVKPFYERWLDGQEDPVDGTPLDVCAFIPPALVGHLKNLLIKTAEDLAAATDGDLERIGMGARGWREKARSYIASKGDSDQAVVNAELKDENKQLRDQLEDLTEQVNSLVNADKPQRRKKAAA